MPPIIIPAMPIPLPGVLRERAPVMSAAITQTGMAKIGQQQQTTEYAEDPENQRGNHPFPWPPCWELPRRRRERRSS